MIDWISTGVVEPPKDGSSILAFWCGVPLYVCWVTALELPEIRTPNKYGNASYEGAWKEPLGGFIYNDPAFWAYIDLPERVQWPKDSDGDWLESNWVPPDPGGEGWKK